MIELLNRGLGKKILLLSALFVFIGIGFFVNSFEVNAETYYCPDGSPATGVAEHLNQVPGSRTPYAKTGVCNVGGTYCEWCSTYDDWYIVDGYCGTSPPILTRFVDTILEGNGENCFWWPDTCAVGGVTHSIGDLFTDSSGCYRLMCDGYYLNLDTYAFSFPVYYPGPYSTPSPPPSNTAVLPVGWENYTRPTIWFQDPTFIPAPSCGPVATTCNDSAASNFGGSLPCIYPGNPNIDLIVWSGAVNVNRGQEANFIPEVWSKEGYFGWVNLSIDECPAGGVCTFDASSIYVPNGSSVNTNLRIDTTNMAVGTYYITVRAEDSTDPWNINDSQTVSFSVYNAASNSARVQGCRVLMPGNTNPGAGHPVSITPVTITGKTTNPLYDNCYTISNLTSGNAYTVNVDNVPGYTVGYTLCTDAIGCHSSIPVMSDSVSISLPLGYNVYADLWWHFFAGQPDYVVQSLSNTPASPTAGDSVTFSGQVKNNGSYAGSENSFTRVRIDIDNDGDYDGPWLYNPTSPLAVGGSENESWSGAWTAVAGTHKYEICADVNEDVFESNESNNCTTKTFTVSGSGSPDLTASTPTQSTAAVGTSKSFTSTVTNNGGAGTGANFYNVFRVATAADGGGTVTRYLSTPSPMSALAASGSNTASYSYTFSSAGTYSVSFCADNNTSMVGTIAESNEGNNCSGWRNVTVSSSGTISVDITSPADGSNHTDANIPITYTVTAGANPIDHCTISVDGGVAMEYPTCKNTTLSYIHTTSNPILAYDFAENTGGIAYDKSVNSFDSAATDISATTGNRSSSNAVGFNGTSSWIAPDNNNNTSSGVLHAGFKQKTVETWFKANTTTGDHTIYEQGGTSNGLYLGINNGVIHFALRNGGVESSVDASFTDTSSWHHVAATFNSGAMEIYLDGVSVGANPASFSSVSSHTGIVGIGRTNGNDADGYGSSGRYFSGSLDDFAIYPTALNLSQIANHYNDSFLSDGNHTVTVVAYDTAAASASDTNSFSISSAALPDYELRSPNVTGTFIEGNTLTFRADVYNVIGNGDATETSSTQLKIDGLNAGINPTAALPVNMTEVEQWTWTATAGNHTYEICADIYNEVAEVNEDNKNCGSGSFNVSAAAEKFGLVVVKAGQGTVISDIPGIICGSDCEEEYEAGTDVVLTATPNSGRIFTGWAGCDTDTKNPDGSGGTCNVTVIDGGNTVYAFFAIDPDFFEF